MLPDITLRPEDVGDAAAVDALYATVFGPGRFARTSWRLRRAAPHEPSVSFVAARRGLIVGAVRQSKAMVGTAPGLLLGPLAVAETAAKRGIGRALMETTLDAADALGATAIVLVGDLAYYAPFGFVRADGLRLDGPAEPHRLLIRAQPTVRGAVRVRDWA